ncbi:ribonuclease H-like domain-containing protein [Tanacetum coccineum]
MTDAKEMWEAIKSRFGGNDESKKMQKYILKQQFKGFSVSNSEGLHKGYDRFQSLLSQQRIMLAGVSTEDANQKFLRSLPSAWSQVSLIMRTKPGMDSLSFDDLYNNLRVFENDVKGSTTSSSSIQNVAFVSENTSSTNDVSTAYGFSNSSSQNSQYEHTSSYSLLANQSSCPQLDHEDLEQLDEFDLEEMDLKWQVAMISMRMKKFYKKTGRKLQFDAKEPVGFDKDKVECYNCHKTGHFARECRTKGNQDSRRRDAWNSRNKDGSKTGKKEDSKALVTINGEGVDWTSHSEEEEDYALMACNSSGSNTKVTSCSKECKESYAKLKKLYDAQREQLSDESIEIKAYTQGLKKVKAQLVIHQQGQLWYEEKIRFIKIDLDDKTDVLTYHKKLLAEAQKEKDDLKAKVEKWHNSFKNLGKLLNSQMSANDKFGLGYGDHRYDGILSYENEVFSKGILLGKESDFQKSTIRMYRFVTAGGMHAVPHPDRGITSIWTLSEPIVNEPNVVCQPKVWSDAPIIEEYESDSEDESCNNSDLMIVMFSAHELENKAYLLKIKTLTGGLLRLEELRTSAFQSLFISQIVTKNKVLFTDSEFSIKNIVPSGGLACLIAKATIDESNKWHRRLGHVTFKNLNKLVKGNLVRGLPLKIFQNYHTCVAVKKGTTQGLPCKANKSCWVFSLTTKDETSGILKDFIRQIKNQLNQKVKTIRCDNGTKFKNMDFIEFYGSKGIKREYSNARTHNKMELLKERIGP